MLLSAGILYLEADQHRRHPIALSFATDNHRFAAATVAARDGQLRTTVRMMNTNSDTAGPFYVADTGSVILKLKWISSSRVLAVF